MVEKPFGTDLASARELNERLLRVLREDQIYRIDHFLGKEPVQDIVYLRFANEILEPIWNRHHIESVQITLAESIDVEGRGAFYDQVGALRDVVQNHLLQVLALVTMEARRAARPRWRIVASTCSARSPTPIRLTASAVSTRGTRRKTACGRDPTPRRSPPCASGSTSGVGPASRS